MRIKCLHLTVMPGEGIFMPNQSNDKKFHKKFFIRLTKVVLSRMI